MEGSATYFFNLSNWVLTTSSLGPPWRPPVKRLVSIFMMKVYRVGATMPSTGARHPNALRGHRYLTRRCLEWEAAVFFRSGVLCRRGIPLLNDSMARLLKIFANMGSSIKVGILVATRLLYRPPFLVANDKHSGDGEAGLRWCALLERRDNMRLFYALR